jgi:hypothetical protein
MRKGVPQVPAKEPDQVPVLTRTADTKTGQTVEGAAPVAKAEMGADAQAAGADAKAQAAGAGGDEGTDNLALGELLARGIGSVYQGATGRELGGNIPEMLSALRQRREAQKLKEQELAAEQAREETRLSRAEQLEAVKAQRLAETERQTNAAYAQSLKRLYPEEAAAGVFDGLEEAAGKPQFAAVARALESRLKGQAERPLISARAATEGERSALVRAQTEKNQAQARAAEAKARATFLSVQSGGVTGKKADNEAKDLGAAGASANDPKWVNIKQRRVDAYNKQFDPTLSQLANIESAAPGFTKGAPPEWLDDNTLKIMDSATRRGAADLAGMTTDPKIENTYSAVRVFLDGYRKKIYGASLTEGERMEMEKIVQSGVFANANNVSVFLDLIRKDTARQYQQSLRGTATTAPVMASWVADFVTNPEGPVAGYTQPGGLLEDVWTYKPTVTAPAAPAAQRPPRPAAPEGKVVMWNKEAKEWRTYLPAGAAKGKADGKLED